MSVHQDRRDANFQRIPFDALVELGGSSESPAFEAQGVDVSPKGMHLRTAYLPDIGQPLVCRFDGHGQEIMADATVVWRKDEDRGGAFGIRFTNVDGESEAALCRMCGLNRAGATGPSQGASEVDPGTRVRLHIDGLGSPMKARVRGASDGEMLVGSNLEFLRVGRPLELEDIDHGGRRPARIDRVDVEVDRESRVPQLIVTLRYDEENATAGQPTVTFADATTADQASASPESPAPRPADRSSHDEGAPSTSGDYSDDEMDSARKVRSGWSAASASWAPSIARWGTQAKTTMSLLWARAFERSGAAASVLRRTTAPPPAGALHASGKRVVRAGSSPELDVPSRRGPSKKTMLALGGATGLAVVVGAVALAKPNAEPPLAGAAATSSSAGPAALPSEPAVGGESLTANVPLFGPTTLASAAAGQGPAPVAAALQVGGGTPSAGTPAFPGAQANAGGSPSMATPGGQLAAAKGGSSENDAASSGSQDDADLNKRVPAFTHGKLTRPVTFRLKTDGAITALHGARTPTGFTVALPGRKAVENAQALLSRDHRVAAVHVNNGAKGTEISVQFKDGVPPYAIRAKGADVQIALGGADERDRNERAERSDRSVRPERAERWDRGERADRSDRSDRSYAADRSDRSDRNERNERNDRSERSERSERWDWGERADRENRDRSDRSDRGERLDRTDRTERYDRSDRAARADRTERSERGYDRGERSDRDERADRSDRDRGDREDRVSRDRADDRDRGSSDRAGMRSGTERGGAVAKKGSVHERQRGTRDSD